MKLFRILSYVLMLALLPMFIGCSVEVDNDINNETGDGNDTELHASLRGSDYIVFVLNETEIEALGNRLSAVVPCSGNTGSIVWRNPSAFRATSPTTAGFYGDYYDWYYLTLNSQVKSGYWYGLTWSLKEASDASLSAGDKALVAEVRGAMNKITTAYTLHLAMSSANDGHYAVGMFNSLDSSTTINIGTPGDGSKYSFPRDGNWHEVEIPMSEFLTMSGFTFASTNILYFNQSNNGGAWPTDIRVDAAFIYKKEGATDDPVIDDPVVSDDELILKEIPTKQRRSAKRGVCSGDFESTDDIVLLSKGVSWYYNWSHNMPSSNVLNALQQCDFSFYPMVWNAGINSSNILNYAQQNPNAFILGYNEPNLTDQANMTPSQAAASWPSLISVAKQAGLKVVSPALNYGTLAGYGDPVKWLTEFFDDSRVNPDEISAIALHCYMPVVNGMRDMIHRFASFGKPIYMTEFCYAEGWIYDDVAKQKQYVSETLNYLETDPMVGGYAWFMARSGIQSINLLGSHTLTELGRIYVNFSSFDKECWYGVGEPIPAEHYVANNLSQADFTRDIAATYGVSVCTDSYGELMLNASQRNAWVEYQLDLPEARKYTLHVRYKAAGVDAKFNLTVGGKDNTLTLPAKAEWHTAQFEITMPKGKSVMRLTNTAGSADINWFYIE